MLPPKPKTTLPPIIIPPKPSYGPFSRNQLNKPYTYDLNELYGYNNNNNNLPQENNLPHERMDTTTEFESRRFSTTASKKHQGQSMSSSNNNAGFAFSTLLPSLKDYPPTTTQTPIDSFSGLISNQQKTRNGNYIIKILINNHRIWSPVRSFSSVVAHPMD